MWTHLGDEHEETHKFEQSKVDEQASILETVELVQAHVC